LTKFSYECYSGGQPSACSGGPDQANDEARNSELIASSALSDRTTGGLRALKEAVLIGCDKGYSVNRWTRALKGKYSLHAVTQRRALVQAVKKLEPQVLVVNLDLLRPRVARTLASIEQLSPATLIIVLSTFASVKEGIAALRAGAKGYSSQRISAVDLERAVRAVLHGELWAGHKIVSGLVAELLSPDTNRLPLVMSTKTSLDNLSARKREIAMLAIEGRVNKEIANRLNISEATVKAHLSGIFRQLHISRRFELARLFALVSSEN
jgi:DNA-binding NarL/FixJ family response regulator